MRLPLVYPILDTATLMRRAVAPIVAAEALLEGGARILQFRHKEHFTREMFEEAKSVSSLCQAGSVQFVINDRADIALLLKAGLHLGQDDLPPSESRRIIGDSAMLGFSTHNESQFRAAADEPVDYLALGPIFATSSKENPDSVVGLEILRKCGADSQSAAPALVPVLGGALVAIGGITRANARAVLAAGADSLAIIGDLYPPECTKPNLRRRMEEWLKLVS